MGGLEGHGTGPSNGQEGWTGRRIHRMDPSRSSSTPVLVHPSTALSSTSQLRSRGSSVFTSSFVPRGWVPASSPSFCPCTWMSSPRCGDRSAIPFPFPSLHDLRWFVRGEAVVVSIPPWVVWMGGEDVPTLHESSGWNGVDPTLPTSVPPSWGGLAFQSCGGEGRPNQTPPDWRQTPPRPTASAASACSSTRTSFEDGQDRDRRGAGPRGHHCTRPRLLQGDLRRYVWPKGGDDPTGHLRRDRGVRGTPSGTFAKVARCRSTDERNGHERTDRWMDVT